MVLEEDVDYIIYAVTGWISFCLFVLCALVVGYLLEWLCPYLLETVGEKVGYLTVAAGLEQLFSLYILGWDLNVEQGTFRGFVWDLDMLMHVLIMGSKIERGGAHHAAKVRGGGVKKVASSDLIAGYVERAKDFDGGADEALALLSKVEEAKEKTMTTTTTKKEEGMESKKGGAQPRKQRKWWQLKRPLEKKPSLRRQILRQQSRWLGTLLRVVLSPRLDNLHETTTSTYAYYTQWVLKHNLDR